MRLKVTFAGPHVTIQDEGRPGLARFGVPLSGPMDRGAFACARRAGAVGPMVEVSLGGLAVEVLEGEGAAVITGGGFIVEHRGRSGSWQRLTLAAGDRLRIRPGPWGMWCYLGFSGPLTAPEWLGSQATHGPSGLGGGRLTSGQVLEIAPGAALPEGPIPCPVWARPRAAIRATPGPQDRFFSEATLDRFFSSPFTLAPAFDRMGLRLAGPSLPPEGALSIPSEAVLRGSVQVNGEGVASVLMADHQTTGGYPKIATVIDSDLDALARLRPGQVLRFQSVDVGQALHLERRYRNLIETGTR